MGKINREKTVSLIKYGFIGSCLLLASFIPLTLIDDEKYEKNFLIIMLFFLGLSVLRLLIFIFYFLYIAYKNDKPKYIDGKYIWRDGRVYEGAWDKKYGANGKGKLTWSDGSYYEGEFKNGHVFGKGKKVVSNGTIFEGTWVDGFLEGKGKIVGEDGGIYEGEFKKGKPDGMGIIKMINGYYYEGEFKEGKRLGKFKKEILSSGTVIEGEFVNNGDGTYDGYGKIIYPGGDTIEEGTFYRGKLNGEGKIYLKNGEYLSGNWINGESSGLFVYHFKDGSYYEGDYKQGWQGIGTYVTKKGDKYPTEFPYEIINVFQYWVSEKIREINKILNYIPKTEEEKHEEKNMYLNILEKGTLLQKEVAELYLQEYEKEKMLLDSIKTDNSIGNALKFHKGLLKIHDEGREKNRKLVKKHHIKIKEKSSYYSYGLFFNRLDGMYGKERDINVLYIKIDEFLHPKNILNLVTKREKKDKERVILIDDFSDKYKDYIQSCLYWREYEKKFWNHNFKPGKKKK